MHQLHFYGQTYPKLALKNQFGDLKRIKTIPTISCKLSYFFPLTIKIEFLNFLGQAEEECIFCVIFEHREIETS